MKMRNINGNMCKLSIIASDIQSLRFKFSMKTSANENMLLFNSTIDFKKLTIIRLF